MTAGCGPGKQLSRWEKQEGTSLVFLTPPNSH